MGALLHEFTKVASKQDKRIAGEIVTHLSPKIAPLREEILKEFKSELVELRKGELKALPDTRDLENNT
jgi:hypothetical protein